MEEQSIAASVTKFKGKPVEVRALLREAEEGGFSIKIVDSVLSWELPSDFAAALVPFLAAKERRLDVDRATDPKKTVLNLSYIGEHGNREVVSVELRQRVAVA